MSEVSKEEYDVLLGKVEQMTHNQNGLVNENNKLQEALKASKEAKKGPQIYAKMLAIKNELGYVAKDQKNSGQGWKFRGIDQFLNAVKPLLDKHGVGMIPEVAQYAEAKFVVNEKTGKTAKNTHIVMKYTFFAEDGSTISSSMPAEGVDPGDKGTNKALSAALKYCLIQTFSVPTEDMAEADKENPSVSGASKAPAKKSASSGTSEAAKPASKSFRRPKAKVEEVDDGDEL